MMTPFTKILTEMAQIYMLSRGHLRFGQIIGNALPGRFEGDPYYIEDEEMLERLVRARQKLETER